MANSLSLRITNVGSQSSLYINDIHDGKDQNGRVNNRKPYQYVPANGSVVVLFTEQVQYSYENGAIRTFINQGLIETFFLMGDVNLLSSDEDGVNYKINVSYVDGTFSLADETDSDVGTSIQVTAGNAIDENGGGIQINAGNSINGSGGSISLETGISDNGSGGSLELRGRDGGVNGGGVYVYGGRGGTGTAGDITLWAGDKPSGDGGNVNIYGGPVWSGGFEAGGVSIHGGGAINTGEDCDSGSVLIEGGGVSIPSPGWINNGGDVTLKSGLGNGAGHSSGNVILEPVAGANGASAGKVVIKGANVTLNEYEIDGVLSVYGGDGTIISNPYGRIETSLLQGDTLTGFSILGAFITSTQVIIVTLEYPNVVGLVLNKPAHITTRVLGVSANVELELFNNSGADVNVYLNWMVLGA